MKFYAVRNGKIPGIYNSWKECQEQTTGFSGAIFKSFTSYDEAQSFISGIQQSHIYYEPISKSKPSIPAGNVIYVDGGCNSHTEGNAWGSVVNKDGVDLIEPYQQLLSDMKLEKRVLPKGPRGVIVCNFNDVSSQQNNGAELLAMVAGLRIAIYSYQNGIQIPYILSDSKLIVEYWSKKVTDGKTYDPLKLQFIQYCIVLRQHYESLGGSILKIGSEKNLADLGWHVSK